MQTVTSAATSLNQVPALHKSTPVRLYLESLHPSERIIVDIGAGRYSEKASNYVRETYHAAYFPSDKYNLPDETNRLTEDLINSGNLPCALCSNVLNVIDDESEVSRVILSAATATLHRKGKAFFTVYEGDKSGIGKYTTKGFQRNAKTEAYFPLIRHWFTNVEKRGKVIIAWN